MLLVALGQNCNQHEAKGSVSVTATRDQVVRKSVGVCVARYSINSHSASGT
jgi:hypothetical protein